MSTKAAGILRRTFVDVGSLVTPDASLTQVDTQEYEVAVAQAESSLSEVLARLGQKSVPDESFDPNQVSAVQRARAQLENARFTHDRLARLSAERQSVSEQEINDASTRLRVAEADHRLALDEAAALAATARERQSIFQIARQKLKDTLTLTPPIPSTLGHEGAEQWIVSERMVTEGQYLSAADPLYRLIISHPLKLRSKVPERYAGEARIGQRVELEIVGGAAFAGGEITRISPSVDPANRTFEIEALIDNSTLAVKPGAFAKGAVIAERAREALCVPVEAVLTSDGKTRVIAVEGGIARERQVEIGLPADGLIEVVSGLRDGDQIVTRGGATLADGATVQARSGP